MIDVSVVIPAHNEPYLQQTVSDLLENARSNVEVIVVLDGWWPNPILHDHPQVKLVHFSESKGMRAAINAGARVAKGKYLMKCDAHCMFDSGYDVKLAQDCEPDWTFVPRRFGMDVERWCKLPEKVYDFQYIEKGTLKGRNWPDYGKRVKGRRVTGLMTSQGSCWFMHKDRFFELGGLDEENYGMMGREAQEVCLKSWLSGGKYLLNRKTWYAHWSKPKEWVINRVREKQKSTEFAVAFWSEGEWPLQWPQQKHELEWLVDMFKPVPSWHDTVTVTDPARYIQDKLKVAVGDNGKARLDGFSRIDLYKMFVELGYKKGCEVGVWEGKNAVNMVRNMPDMKLILVDPYENSPYVRKPRGVDRIKNAKRRALARLSGNTNVEFIIEMSEKAINLVPDESLDWVYIDAEHHYDMVMLDIILWNRKVRRGGIVSGHDYYWDPKNNITVPFAVDDYAKIHGITPVFLTDSKADQANGEKRGFTSWFWVKE
jgi:cellulose synthase/poly-beta-1,6-N-acetylglucosamine synthase-like glycosyltransferase